MIQVRLSSGLTIAFDPQEWPEIGAAEWTTQRDGGVVEGRVLIRRHSDGRTLMYIDANPAGDGVFVRGDLLPLEIKEIDDAVARFGELHAMPNWVVARCIQSVRG